MRKTKSLSTVRNVEMTAFLLLVLTGLLGLRVSQGAASKYYHGYGIPPGDIMVTNNRIFIPMNEFVTVLHKNLSAIGKLYYKSSSPFWPFVLSGSDRLFILNFSKDGNCSLGSYHNDSMEFLKELSFSNRNENQQDISFSVASIIKSDKALYMGIIRKSTSKSKSVELVAAKIENSSSSPKKFLFAPMQFLLTKTEDFETREYLYTFHRGHYSYFVVKDKFIMPTTRVIMKIVRREKNPHMLPAGENYEVDLQTKFSNHNLKGVIYFVIHGMLVLGQTDQKTLIFHSFSLSKVDKVLDSTIEKCSRGQYEFYASWSQETISCSELNGQVSCNCGLDILLRIYFIIIRYIKEILWHLLIQ